MRTRLYKHHFRVQQVFKHKKNDGCIEWNYKQADSGSASDTISILNWAVTICGGGQRKIDWLLSRPWWAAEPAGEWREKPWEDKNIRSKRCAAEWNVKWPSMRIDTINNWLCVSESKATLVRLLLLHVILLSLFIKSVSCVTLGSWDKVRLQTKHFKWYKCIYGDTVA